VPPTRDAKYYYRRAVSLRESLPAVATGIAVGAVAFYVTRLLIQRTPLERDGRIAQVDRLGAVEHFPREGRGGR
jgi:hypothetical protein